MWWSGDAGQETAWMVSEPKVDEVKIYISIHLSELSIKSLLWWESESGARLRTLNFASKVLMGEKQFPLSLPMLCKMYRAEWTGKNCTEHHTGAPVDRWRLCSLTRASVLWRQKSFCHAKGAMSPLPLGLQHVNAVGSTLQGMLANHLNWIFQLLPCSWWF